VDYNYPYALETLKLDTLKVRRQHTDALFFLINVFLGSKLCPSLLDNISPRVPTCNSRNYNQFFASRQYCPSARRAATANLVCCDIDIFCKDIKSFRDIRKPN
jgi:hypothetical protein